MAFLQVLADDVVKNDVWWRFWPFWWRWEWIWRWQWHLCFTREIRHEDVIGDYSDKENTSEEQDNDAIEMPETSAETEDEHEGSSCVSLLGDTCTADPCLRRSRLRVTGGERQRREMEVRKPKT